MKNKPLILLLAIVVLPALACAEFIVVNTSPNQATVLVTLPDGVSGSRPIDAYGSSSVWFAFSGGTYIVEVLPNEGYRAILLGVRERTSNLLSAVSFTPEELARYKRELETLQQQIDQIGEGNTICKGTIDAESEKTITVTISFDTQTGHWLCQ